MSIQVIDASVAAKWFFKEPASDAAAKLLAPTNDLLAPDLLRPEFGNIVWKRVQRKEIVADEANDIIATFLKIPLVFISSGELLAQASQLAILTGRSAYDCLYLALAVKRNGRLTTADDRFFNAISGTPWAKYIRPLDHSAETSR